MSESSKMGLFGSKDENKDPKKEDSPDRYAPYCLDNTSEAYDTEALSMMDINDIIGVQAEPMADSTLESEIAALTEIITGTKSDGSQDIMEEKTVLQVEDSAKEQRNSGDESVVSDNTSINNGLVQGICNQPNVVCDSQTVPEVNNVTEPNCTTADFDKLDIDLQELTDNCSLVSNNKPNKFSLVDSNPILGDVISKESSDNASDVQYKDTTSEVMSKDTQKIETLSNLGGSLKLIGEAYTSEDSQEGSSNDTDSKEDVPSNNFIEKPTAPEQRISEETVSHISEHRIKQSELLNTEISTQSNIAEQLPEVAVEEKCEDDETKSSKVLTIGKIDKEDALIENICESPKKAIVEEQKATEEKVITEMNVPENEPSMEMDAIEYIGRESEAAKQDIIEKCERDLTIGTEEEEKQDNNETLLTKVKDDESVTVAESESIASTQYQVESPKGAINTNDSCETIKDDSDVPGEIHMNKQLEESDVQSSSGVVLEDLPKKLEESEVQNGSESSIADVKSPSVQESGHEETCNKVTDSITLTSTDDTPIKPDACLEINTKDDTQTNVSPEETNLLDQGIQHENSDIENEVTESSDAHTELKTVDDQDSDAHTELKTVDDQNSDICNIKDPEKHVSESDTTLKAIDQTTLEEAPTAITPAIEEKESIELTEAEILEGTEAPASPISNEKESDHVDTDGNKEETIVPEASEKEIIADTKNEVSDDSKDISNTVMSEDQDIIADDLEEEAIEEEMNLTFELEEPEPHIDITENADKVPESKKIDAETDREENKGTGATEYIEPLSTEIVEVKKSTDDNNDNTELAVAEDMKQPSIDTADDEKSDLPEPCIEERSSDSDLNVPIERKEQELDTKQHIEESGEVETSNKDLDVMTKTTAEPELFLQEQCQSTLDVADSIVEDKNAVDDLTNILINEPEDVNKVEDILQDSLDSSVVEPEVGALLEKLQEASEETLDKPIMDVPSITQSVDSLEGLLDLNTISENEDSLSRLANVTEESQEQESFENNVQLDQLLQKPNASMEMEEKQNDMLSVIDSCLVNIADKTVEEDDKEPNDNQDLKKSAQPEDVEICEAINKNEGALVQIINKEIVEAELPKSLETDIGLPISEMDIDFMGGADGSVDLEESDSKIELPSDELLQGEEQTEADVITPCVETSQPSSEISELESAVKFLQESEEQALDSPLVLSPKMIENDLNDVSKQAETSSLFVGDEGIGEDTSELVAELQDIATDSIDISEAEIISEAAKLENEKKLAEQVKVDSPLVAQSDPEDSETNTEKVNTVIPEVEVKVEDNKLEPIQPQTAANIVNEPVSILPNLSQRVLKPSENIPKVSLLEERLKEPPKIEIPISDVTKLTMSPTTTKDSLLIQKDAKLLAYQKMMESPKASEKSEPKITDTPRKDSADKHEFESVGSPRIILKIAKSAIADCTEPRSPKSPKIRSATNSPNPEDSPGQKLGKIKLKLSKGGHPSIISNDNVEDAMPWHSEGTASLSPIGMKIKFSKSGDASIVSAEKHEGMDDIKDGRHKYEEIKRTESPIGMKIKLSKTGDASIIQEPKDVTKHKEKLDMMQGSPKRTESPIGMKIKLSKSGDASIIQPEKQDFLEEQKDGSLKSKDLCYASPKRTDSPIGMKIKLSKSGDASIVSPDTSEDPKETGMLKEKADFNSEMPKRTDSPIGMKIKLAKTKGGASIIPLEGTEEPRERLEIPELPKRTDSPLGMKIKLSKTGDASIIHSEVSEDNRSDSKEKSEGAQDLRMPKLADACQSEQEFVEKSDATPDFLPKVESPIGMKIKLSKFGDPSIVQPTEKREQSEEQRSRETFHDTPKRTDSPLGMKIKLSKTGDASIIQNDISEDTNRSVQSTEQDPTKISDSSLGMKIKLLKSGDASIVESEKKEKSRRRDSESPLEMKIKLSKTGHPTIVTCDTHAEGAYKSKDASESPQSFSHRYKESMTHKESTLKMLKTTHSNILQSNRSELTIEPVQVQNKKMDNAIEISPKRKEITISPIEPKKSKLETQLSQILPEVTIQPVMSRDQKQLIFDPKSSLISRQQMNVISQEISITQVRASKTPEGKVPEKLKDILTKNVTDSPLGSDCEIIEHRPELIIVNENSNSSQDVMIIEEVPPLRTPDFKGNKRRGRPRRGGASHLVTHAAPQVLMTNDQIAVEAIRHPASQVGPRENERPKRTCRSQKSYAPPKRGRGRGRGKRKLDGIDLHSPKRAKLDQDLSAIEASTMAVITLDGTSNQRDSLEQSELYKALQQPPADGKLDTQYTRTLCETKVVGVSDGITDSLQIEDANLQEGDSSKAMPKPPAAWDVKDKDKKPDIATEKGLKTMTKPGTANWLTPPSKKQIDTGARPENVSTVQVIDEETRMSAESSSRCQTPARNISIPASDNIVNEESQGSVLSTATTESEKVKVKNRRMEINFDPDEGPFTVDKIAEYEWPLDRKGETFMIQEQISQYLGVKSFKRKYPDLKRRMVDMEERNYLRENGLVSEAMCDMGLTAVCSSEVLDVMCSDFPDQYEEYRKHMREKQVKEHSKKQKELTAAANAEKNRIDLAEMAVQSALTWNMSLNKARKESRKCSLDLQTFTVHVPKKQQKVDPDRKVSHYPVALIPGQYTDYYREYTAAELRYYPLNTVLYGPMRPNERKFDSQSEGSQSDSDSDSSSDDSSSTSSEGTQDTEGSQSTMDDVDIEIVNQKDEIKLKCKMCLKSLNKNSKNEVLIQCGTCNGHVHPSCIDLTLDMVPHIQSYAWQCTDCKTCAQCHDPADEDKMLFCDMCDRGYHIYCVGLRRVPQGRWHCQECAVCASCGSREAGGANSDRNSVAQWQHEYKKGDKNTRVYVSTLCVPCSKLWRKGRYCPHCSRCHTAPRLDLEANLVHCSACDKYLHLGCVEIKGQVVDRKNYLCDFCIPNRHHVMKPLVSKTLKS